MSVNLDIKLKKSNKIYFEGDCVTGLVVISSPTDVKHDGITLVLEGIVSLQFNNKNAGMFDSLRNTVKPITLISNTIDLQPSGKVPSGLTEIPFEFPLKTIRQKPAGSDPSAQPCLLETYHGVFVSVIYTLKCTLKRSFLNKDVNTSCMFVIQYRKSNMKIKEKPVRCLINPQTIQNLKSLVRDQNQESRSGHNIPKFNICVDLDSTVCSLDKPFTGKVTVKECSVPIKSIELQLVRVETCGCGEGYPRDVTEIQNIQIGEGDICKNLPIPIYMLFPRLFTCPTTLTTNFKIEFEVNIAIIFFDDYLLTENFPIILTRT